MTRSRLMLLLAIALLILPLIARPVRAQTPAEAGGRDTETDRSSEGTEETSPAPRREPIEEITVTARKREETLLETPISVRAFSAAELASRGYTQLSDIGRSTANLRFEQLAGTVDAALIYIRGVGQDDFRSLKDPGVGLYLDGVYLPRLQGSLLQLVDVSRIEVLRGPQGTLYGRNTVGGLINVISRKPTSEVEANVLIRVANFKSVESRTRINLPLPGPLGDYAYARLSLATTDTDGFMTNVLDGQDAGGRKLRGGRFALRVEPNESVTVDLAYDFSYSRRGQPLGHCVPKNPFTFARFAIDNYTEYQGRNFPAWCAISSSLGTEQGMAIGLGRSQATLHGVTAIAGWMLPWFDLKYTGSFRSRATEGFGADLDYTPIDFLGIEGASWTRHRATSHELNLSGEGWGDRLQYVTGLYYFLEMGEGTVETSILRQFVIPELRAQLPTSPTIDSPPFQIPFGLIDSAVQSASFDRRVAELVAEGLSSAVATAQATSESATRECCLGIVGASANLNAVRMQDYETESLAAYGQITAELVESLKLSLGLRYTYEVKSRGGAILRVFPGESSPQPTPLPQKDRFRQLTPAANLAWEATDELMMYFRYARGWKSGGFNQSVLTTEEASNGMFLKFDPEVLDSVELGVKTRWLDGRLSVDLTGFYSLYDDIQVSSLLLNAEGSVEARIDNAATATIRGFELEGRWLLEQDWLPGRNAFASLSGGIGYVDAVFDSYDRLEFEQAPPPAGCTSLRLEDCDTTLGGLLTKKAPIIPYLAQLTEPTPAVVDRSSLDFKNTPTWSVNVSGLYSWRVTTPERIITRVDYYYQSEIWYDTLNTIREDGYGLLGLRLSLVSERFGDLTTRLTFIAKNVTNERVIAGGLPLGETVGSDAIYYNRPRVLGGEIAVRY